MIPRLCACMGPMYGEPYCCCTMKELKIPFKEARKRSQEQMKKLFEPGGFFYELNRKQNEIDSNK